MTFLSSLYLLTHHFYHPHYNGFPAGKINGISINAYVYLLIIISAGTVYFLNRLIIKIGKAKNSVSFLFILRICAFVACILTVVLQTIQQEKYFGSLRRQYTNKTTEEKNEYYFGDTYRFAMFCRGLVKGRHGAQLRTDFDPSKTLEPHALAYYLYPALNVAFKDTGSIYYLVVFEKANPFDDVPDNFQIIGIFDPHNLLAVKKQPF